jgi:hypothetical protein
LFADEDETYNRRISMRLQITWILPVFFTRNSHVAGTGAASSPPASSAAVIVPVGALAIAKKIGFTSSPAVVNIQSTEVGMLNGK